MTDATQDRGPSERGIAVVTGASSGIGGPLPRSWPRWGTTS